MSKEKKELNDKNIINKKPGTANRKASSATSKTVKKKVLEKDVSLNNKIITVDFKKIAKEKNVVTTKKADTSKRPTKVNTKTSKAKTPRKKATSNVKKSTKTVSNVEKPLNFIEYYDLPYRYNQTLVKVLAQTPTTLFVYWDISDIDRENFIKKFGKDFFSTTYPVLIVHNQTYNYSFEIPINDFANSWYFTVNDSKCDYSVELGRRSKSDKMTLPNNYIHVSSSNKIEAPNDHILFEKAQKTIYFRNVKTNEVTSKNIVNLQFIHRIGRIYNIYDLYKKIYKDETITKLDNPSSLNNPTSGFNSFNK